MQDTASDAYDSAANAAHEATREPTTFEKAKAKLSPPSTADRVKAGAADAYAQAQVCYKERATLADQALDCSTGRKQSIQSGWLEPGESLRVQTACAVRHAACTTCSDRAVLARSVTMHSMHLHWPSGPCPWSFVSACQPVMWLELWVSITR